MGMTVRKVTDPAFKAYGRIITGYDFSGLLKAMEQTPLPEDVIYIPSLPEMEALPAAKELENGIYGQMPIQIGCCNGISPGFRSGHCCGRPDSDIGKTAGY